MKWRNDPVDSQLQTPGVLAEMAWCNAPEHLDQMSLKAGQARAFDAGRRRRDVLVCLEGKIWLTQQGDMRDYLIKTGDVFIAPRPGRILAYALKDARIAVASTRDGRC